jgi:hypothetical protein
MTDELKPCPFCGGTVSYYIGTERRYFKCSSCKVECEMFGGNISKDVGKWNKQSGDGQSRESRQQATKRDYTEYYPYTGEWVVPISGSSD